MRAGLDSRRANNPRASFIEDRGDVAGAAWAPPDARFSLSRAMLFKHAHQFKRRLVAVFGFVGDVLINISSMSGVVAGLI